MREPDELLLHSTAITFPSTGVDVGPEQAGWTYVSLRTVRIQAGGFFNYSSGRRRNLPGAAQGAATVDTHGSQWEISRPGTVFDGKPTALYLPRESNLTITGHNRLRNRNHRITGNQGFPTQA